MQLRKQVDVPELEHDAMMLAKWGSKVDVNGRIERRIVAALCAHMAQHGWSPALLNDLDRETKVHDTKSAMELIFNLDDCWLYFSKDGPTDGPIHPVRLISGNGIDIISDWHYAHDDVDGFNAVMDAFEPEDYL